MGAGSFFLFLFYVLWILARPVLDSCQITLSIHFMNSVFLRSGSVYSVPVLCSLDSCQTWILAGPGFLPDLDSCQTQILARPGFLPDSHFLSHLNNCKNWQFFLQLKNNK